MNKRLKLIITAFLIAYAIAAALPIFSYWALASFVYFIIFLVFLFEKVNTELPFKEIFCVLMGLQMLVGPSLVYSGFDEYQGFYRMKLDETSYFIYVFPAVLAFTAGMFILGKKASLKVDLEALRQVVAKEKRLSFILIIAGFVASFIQGFFPSELRFVFYLIACLKYVGLFILLLSDRKIPIKWLVVIYGSILISSFSQAMFHDLMMWSIFLAIILTNKYKPKRYIKLAGVGIFIIFAILIQTIKGTLRQNLWNEEEELTLDLLDEVTAEAISEEGLFQTAALAPQITRINQGHIISSVMNQVPAKEPHTNGALLKSYLEAALLPRVLAPNKLQAGSKETFNKYSGLYIQGITSMGLSSVADGYIDFGKVGGCVFMFLYALLFSFALMKLNGLRSIYPMLPLFSFIIFLYPIRPDCETQTLLGHFFKAIFLVWVLFRIYKKKLKLNTTTVTLHGKGKVSLATRIEA